MARVYSLVHPFATKPIQGIEPCLHPYEGCVPPETPDWQVRVQRDPRHDTVTLPCSELLGPLCRLASLVLLAAVLVLVADSGRLAALLSDLVGRAALLLLAARKNLLSDLIDVLHLCLPIKEVAGLLPTCHGKLRSQSYDLLSDYGNSNSRCEPRSKRAAATMIRATIPYLSWNIQMYSLSVCQRCGLCLLPPR